MFFFLIREFAVLKAFEDIVLIPCALCVIHVCTQMVVLVYLYIHLWQCSYSTIDFVSSHINSHIKCMGLDFCLFDPLKLFTPSQFCCVGCVPVGVCLSRLS